MKFEYEESGDGYLVSLNYQTQKTKTEGVTQQVIDLLKQIEGEISRFQLMEALWDIMLYENQTIDVPEWHENILTERKEKITAGTAKFISLAELKTHSDQ